MGIRIGGPAPGTYARASLAVGAFGSVMAALDEGQSASILVQGDSTGNDAGEWVDLLARWLGGYKPAQRVIMRMWDDVNQRYPDWTILQAGSSGERHALFTPAAGAATRTMYVPDTYIPAVTGDLDLRVKVDLSNYATGAVQTLVARFAGAGSRSFTFQVSATGRLQLNWSADGTAILSAAPPPNPTVTPGTPVWLRATLDVDNGQSGYTVTTYTSPDGVTWTTLGSTVTTAGITSIFSPASLEYEIGGRATSNEIVSGKIYEVQIRNGIDGPIVNPQPIEAWTPRLTTQTGTITPTFGGSPTVYVVNGSRAGADVTYLNDTTRLPRMVPPYVNPLMFLSCLHNEGENVGLMEKTRYDAWLTALKARVPTAVFIALTQNPETAPRDASQLRFHAKRRQELLVWAARNGLYAIDTYKAFLDDPRGLAALINTDGVHPLIPEGEQVWVKAVQDAFLARL